LFERALVFLRRAGTVILGVAVGLWILSHVPLHDGQFPPIEQSVAGTLGRAVEPVIRPLGFNWKIGIGLVTSLAAREVIVGTLGTIYGMEGSADNQGLQAAVQRDLTLAGAVALLVFFTFAMQCMSTLAVVRRETGGWKWPAIQFAYMTGLAYVSSFVAYRLFS
jgi:ferrous iron transport protein B